MDSLLQEITALPGVFGCFVYDGAQHIAGSKMPPIFRKSNIKAIGNMLVRTVQMGKLAQMDFKGIEIKYNESLLMIKPLAREALLILICEPSANKSLITMTTGMLATDIETAMARTMRAHPDNHRAAGPETVETPAKQSESAAIDEKLAPILEQVKDALAMAIGPIAGPVMKDSIEIWAKQGPPSTSSLPALAKLLCAEIADKELEKEFMAQISKIKR